MGSDMHSERQFWLQYKNQIQGEEYKKLDVVRLRINNLSKR